MDTAVVREIGYQSDAELQISAETQTRALSDPSATRQLRQAVLNRAAAQIKKEEETRAMAPDAYRLSLLSEAAINGKYRLGKRQMGSNDLVRYFQETRQRRIQNADFSGNTGIDSLEEPTVSDASNEDKDRASRAVVLVEQVKALPQTAGAKLKAAMPGWFDTAKPDTSREKKRFPLSAFAAIGAVAMSLMLIVASSVLVRRAEGNLANLRLELNAATNEVAELKSDFEVRHDMLEIRRIAVEEYGMVEEDYLKMQYISIGSEDSVEVFDDGREKGVGLSAILSAMFN